MKTLISTIALLFVCTLYAQNFQGKAIYKTSSKSTFKIKDDKGVNDKMQEELRKRIQKMNQKTFILNFDKYTSTYKEEVALEAPKSQFNKKGLVVMSLGGSGGSSIYYKNIQAKNFSNQTEIMGKSFLIKDKLPDYKWVLSSETKNIGTYTCYKASFSKEVESKNITFKNGESVEEVKKETIVTTAWYTLQVPVSNGPDDYQGLPGLILEINDGKKTIVCTEIILNPSEKSIIIKPLKGKVVSQKRFNKIEKQKSDEMMEKFKSRKGFDLGNGVNVKIGG